MNSKLHAIADATGRLLRMFLTAGQRSDYIGTCALLDGLPLAEHMLADRGYDADWYRQALEEKGITPCIPFSNNRKFQSPMTKPDPQAPQDRQQLRPPQGLAARRNTLRQVSKGLPVGMRTGCRCHDLVMNPDLSSSAHDTRFGGTAGQGLDCFDECFFPHRLGKAGGETLCGIRVHLIRHHVGRNRCGGR